MSEQSSLGYCELVAERLDSIATHLSMMASKEIVMDRKEIAAIVGELRNDIRGLRQHGAEERNRVENRALQAHGLRLTVMVFDRRGQEQDR